MKSILRFVINKIKTLHSLLKAILSDSHLVPSECPPMPAAQKFSITQRSRLAGIGLPVSKNEKTITHLKNCHKGERAFIIGNGPSLLKCDLSKLKDEYTFGVNSIFLNYENMGFHPTYYVVEDVYVGEDRSKEINQYTGPKYKFFGNYFKYCLNENPDTLWLNVRFRYDDYPEFPYFSTNAARQVWVGGTVTYICLQLAYYMGFSEIYMIGFDHNYVIPDSAKVDKNLIISTNDDPNHFHPDYFGKGYRWHDPKVERMEKAFLKAKQVFEADDRKIFNATVGGNLNVFERIEYSNLFGLDK